MESQPPADQLPGIAVSTFDSSGRGPLLVPGAGMPLVYYRAAHAAIQPGRIVDRPVRYQQCAQW